MKNFGLKKTDNNSITREFDGIKRHLKPVDKQKIIRTIFVVISIIIFVGILVGGLFMLFGEYSIELDLADGERVYFQTYNVNSGNITLGIPKRDGYRFTGWTGSNGNKPQKDVTVKKGTIGDLTYVANWATDLTVVCEDWLVDKNGNLVRDITSEVDKYLKDGKSGKKYSEQERTINVDAGTVVNASQWGDDKSYNAYCNK